MSDLSLALGVLLVVVLLPLALGVVLLVVLLPEQPFPKPGPFPFGRWGVMSRLLTYYRT